MEPSPNPVTDLWNHFFSLSDCPLCLEIGDLCLVVQKLTHEWQLNYHWGNHGNNGLFQATYLDADAHSPEQVDRIALEQLAKGIKLLPRLANLPLVVRPYSPFTIPAGNKVTLFVTTPVWLQVEFAEGVSREFPVQKLSETWMGPPTGDGDLCYGSHTHARLDEKLLLQRPWRALTPIHLHNDSDEHITLERLSIPTPYLSTFMENTQLVTEPLRIKLEAGNHRGTVNIEKRKTGTLMSPPRLATDRGILERTWENLFA